MLCAQVASSRWFGPLEALCYSYKEKGLHESDRVVMEAELRSRPNVLGITKIHDFQIEVGAMEQQPHS